MCIHMCDVFLFRFDAVFMERRAWMNARAGAVKQAHVIAYNVVFGVQSHKICSNSFTSESYGHAFEAANQYGVSHFCCAPLAEVAPNGDGATLVDGSGSRCQLESLCACACYVCLCMCGC